MGDLHCTYSVVRLGESQFQQWGIALKKIKKRNFKQNKKKKKQPGLYFLGFSFYGNFLCVTKNNWHCVYTDWVWVCVCVYIEVYIYISGLGSSALFWLVCNIRINWRYIGQCGTVITPHIFCEQVRCYSSLFLCGK